MKNQAQKRIVLASASPRRLEILHSLGLEPVVMVAQTEELKEGEPGFVVTKNAELKASAVLSLCAEEDIIVAADTVVVMDDQILGKPKDAEDAKRMLALLSGRAHDVYSGVCVISAADGIIRSGYSKTTVYFDVMDEDSIISYVASGEPLDKAGAYGIQGKGGIFVNAIEGDYGTVVGLSPNLFAKLARLAGFNICDSFTNKD